MSLETRYRKKFLKVIEKTRPRRKQIYGMAYKFWRELNYEFDRVIDNWVYVGDKTGGHFCPYPEDLEVIAIKFFKEKRNRS